MIVQPEIHPRLAEEAVREAVRGRIEEEPFHRERERLYERPDEEARDRAFAIFYFRWFRKLELEAPIREAVAEQGRALDAVSRCRLGPAPSARRAGAELFVAGPDDRSVVLLIPPALLARRQRALEFLRRELLLIADMLDPAFEYDPRLPALRSGPSRERRIRERYGVLWRCSVDGRLVGQGRLPAPIREDRRLDFGAAFPGLGVQQDRCFEQVFAGPRPRHSVLLALATAPETAFGVSLPSTDEGGPCPLCGFPTVRFEPEPRRLPSFLQAWIRHDFPAWTADDGICLQCAELYRVRSLSRGAAGCLPGAPSR